MSTDIPLPTPLSVMSSPSHMIRPVPAVMVSTMMRIVTMESSTRMFVQPGFPKSWEGLRANVMRVADWRTASAMVRYRVYCVEGTGPLRKIVRLEGQLRPDGRRAASGADGRRRAGAGGGSHRVGGRRGNARAGSSTRRARRR